MLGSLALTHEREPLALWPNGNPDGWTRPDAEVVEQADAGFQIVKNVSNPTLELFPSSVAGPDAPTVIVCPGGGYWVLAIEHEGVEIARKLNEAGYHAAVLKYRLPNHEMDKPLHRAPLQDAQRAIRLVRASGLGAGPVGIMGFSAGGHLAAATSTAPEATYAPVDTADQASCRPDFSVLVYPASLSTEGRPELPSDITVGADTPPAFIVQTMDDRELVMSAFSYAIACQRAAVPAELHVFPSGGHGYGLRTTEPGIAGWMDLLLAWLGRLP